MYLQRNQFSNTGQFDQSGQIAIAAGADFQTYVGANVLPGSKFSGEGKLQFVEGVSTVSGFDTFAGDVVVGRGAAVTTTVAVHPRSLGVMGRFDFNASQTLDFPITLAREDAHLGGTGDVTMSGAIDWNVGTTIDGAGKMIVPAGGSFAFGAATDSTTGTTRYLARQVVVNGKLTFNRFTVIASAITGKPTLLTDAGGTLRLNESLFLTSTAASLRNDGTLLGQAGQLSGFKLLNNGTLQTVTDGGLDLGAANPNYPATELTSSVSGVVRVVANSQLTISGVPTFAAPVAITGAGTVDFKTCRATFNASHLFAVTGGLKVEGEPSVILLSVRFDQPLAVQTLTLSGWALDLNDVTTIGRLETTGGFLRGTGSVAVTGSGNLASPYLQGSGVLTFASSAPVTLKGGKIGKSISNHGILSISGSFTIDQDTTPTLTNEKDGHIEFSGVTLPAASSPGVSPPTTIAFSNSGGVTLSYTNNLTGLNINNSGTIGGNTTTTFGLGTSSGTISLPALQSLGTRATFTRDWTFTVDSIVSIGGVAFTGGTHTIAGSFTVAGKAYSGRTLSDPFTTITGATVGVSSAVDFGVVQLNADGLLQLTASAATLRTTGLAFVGNGALDVGRASLIVDYDSAATPPNVLTPLLAGRHGGAWDGAGIRSGDAASSGGQMVIGLSSSALVLGPNGGTFAGVSVDGSAWLLRYTLAGDPNLDRTVDANDLAILTANAGGANKIFGQGDLNFDSFVNDDDAAILAAQYGQTPTV